MSVRIKCLLPVAVLLLVLALAVLLASTSPGRARVVPAVPLTAPTTVTTVLTQAYGEASPRALMVSWSRTTSSGSHAGDDGAVSRGSAGTS